MVPAINTCKNILFELLPRDVVNEIDQYQCLLEQQECRQYFLASIGPYILKYEELLCPELENTKKYKAKRKQLRKQTDQWIQEGQIAYALLVALAQDHAFYKFLWLLEDCPRPPILLRDAKIQQMYLYHPSGIDGGANHARELRRLCKKIKYVCLYLKERYFHDLLQFICKNKTALIEYWVDHHPTQIDTQISQEALADPCILLDCYFIYKAYGQPVWNKRHWCDL